MRSHFILIILLSTINFAYSQNDLKKLTFEFDSLTRVKSNYENQINSLKKEQNDIEIQIKNKGLLIDRLILDNNSANGTLYSSRTSVELIENPYPTSPVIANIPANDKYFLFYFFYDNYALVNYKGKIGYITFYSVSDDLKYYFELSKTRTALEQIAFFEKNNLVIPDTLYTSKSTDILQIPKKPSKVLLTVDIYTPLIVYYKSTTYSLVKLDSTIGYTFFTDYLLTNDELQVRKNIEIEKQRMAEALKQEGAKNEELAKQYTEKKRLELIKSYGAEKGKKIFEGYMWIGMTKEMLIDSWGSPTNINRTVGSWGVHEQWVYSSGTYVYLENDIVTSWQD